jgi:hypothetical protein
MALILFLEDVFQILEYAKWIILFYIAWWYYNWSKEHLAFSPLLTLVVGGILVYYLVIEHPIIGGLGVLGWVLLTSGILYLVPVVGSLYNTFFGKKMH